jgi:hypothetical protein
MVGCNETLLDSTELECKTNLGFVWIGSSRCVPLSTGLSDSDSGYLGSNPSPPAKS